MIGDFAETIYKGRDNPLVMRITKWKAAFGLVDNAVTKVAVVVGPEMFDSETNPEVVVYDNDYITAVLGPVVTAGKGTVDGRVVIFDVGHANGVVVGHGSFTIA